MANALQILSALCYGLHMGTGIDQKKRVIRWRRNKRDARARAKPDPTPLAPEFVTSVMAERDRRAADRDVIWRAWWNGGYEYSERNLPFAADVWAARTLLAKQLGAVKATPTRIARWLAENDRAHGYSVGSLRPMVYRALNRITLAETTPRWRGEGEPYWPAFT